MKLGIALDQTYSRRKHKVINFYQAIHPEAIKEAYEGVIHILAWRFLYNLIVSEVVRLLVVISEQKLPKLLK